MRPLLFLSESGIKDFGLALLNAYFALLRYVEMHIFYIQTMSFCDGYLGRVWLFSICLATTPQESPMTQFL